MQGFCSSLAEGVFGSPSSGLPKDEDGELRASSLSFFAALTGVCGRGEPRLVDGELLDEATDLRFAATRDEL